MAQNIAYLRVSTADQETEKNKADILLFANERDFGKIEFVEETMSGTKSWRDRKIFGIIERLGEGDRLLIPELTRLGRSTLDVLEILKTAQDKGICVYSVKERMELDDSMQSKVMRTFMALFAEIERDFISKRIKEALKARKASGVILGRPKGRGKSRIDEFKPEIEALFNNGSTLKFVSGRYKVTPQNLINWLRKNGLEKYLRSKKG